MKKGKSCLRAVIKVVCVILVICVLAYTVFYALGRMKFETTFYQLDSAKVEDRIRVIEVADLHNWEFGKNNKNLVERIQELEPDIILVAGDLVRKENRDVSVASILCKQMTEIAPVYYVYGNHENELIYGANIDEEFVNAYKAKLGNEAFEGRFDYSQFEIVDNTLPAALKDIGVTILNNETASLTVNGVQVDIAGINSMSGTYYPTSAGMVHDFMTTNPDNVKLIVTHYPEVAFAGMADQNYFEFDALVCGHKHGGIIRIPGMGGMISHEGWNSLFEGYDSGIIEMQQGPVVISRGLGQSNLIPRINNTPELVVIDIE